MCDNVSLHTFSENDLQYLSMLLCNKEITETLHIEPIPYKDIVPIYEHYWKNDVDEQNFIILYNNDRAGWLKINGLDGADIAWISMLVIAPEYQRKGIGSAALQFAEQYIKDKGFNFVGIKTTKDNIIAKNLYLKCGYRIVSDIPNQSADSYSRYVFEKNIRVSVPRVTSE